MQAVGAKAVLPESDALPLLHMLEQSNIPGRDAAEPKAIGVSPNMGAVLSIGSRAPLGMRNAQTYSRRRTASGTA